MASMAKVTCTRPGCGLACSSPSVDEVMAWSEAHDQHCPSLRAQEIAPRLLADAKKQGAVEALTYAAEIARRSAAEMATATGTPLVEGVVLGIAASLNQYADQIESGEVALP